MPRWLARRPRPCRPTVLTNPFADARMHSGDPRPRLVEAAQPPPAQRPGSSPGRSPLGPLTTVVRRLCAELARSGRVGARSLTVAHEHFAAGAHACPRSGFRPSDPGPTARRLVVSGRHARSPCGIRRGPRRRGVESPSLADVLRTTDGAATNPSAGAVWRPACSLTAPRVADQLSGWPAGSLLLCMRATGHGPSCSNHRPGHCELAAQLRSGAV